MFIHFSDTIKWEQSALHPVLLYMRSLALFGYILQSRTTPNILYMLILVVNLYISIYVLSIVLWKHNIYNNAFKLQDCRRLNKVCDL